MQQANKKCETQSECAIGQRAEHLLNHDPSLLSLLCASLSLPISKFYTEYHSASYHARYLKYLHLVKATTQTVDVNLNANELGVAQVEILLAVAEVHEVRFHHNVFVPAEFTSSAPAIKY